MYYQYHFSNLSIVSFLIFIISFGVNTQLTRLRVANKNKKDKDGLNSNDRKNSGLNKTNEENKNEESNKPKDDDANDDEQKPKKKKLKKL